MVRHLPGGCAAPRQMYAYVRAHHHARRVRAHRQQYVRHDVTRERAPAQRAAEREVTTTAAARNESSVGRSRPPGG